MCDSDNSCCPTPQVVQQFPFNGLSPNFAVTANTQSPATPDGILRARALVGTDSNIVIAFDDNDALSSGFRDVGVLLGDSVHLCRLFSTLGGIDLTRTNADILFSTVTLEVSLIYMSPSNGLPENDKIYQACGSKKSFTYNITTQPPVSGEILVPLVLGPLTICAQLADECKNVILPCNTLVAIMVDLIVKFTSPIPPAAGTAMASVRNIKGSLRVENLISCCTDCDCCPGPVCKKEQCCSSIVIN